MIDTQNEAEYLKGKLTSKRHSLQCEIVRFSECGRFPTSEDFEKIGVLSVELAQVEYSIKMIAFIE